ncbi:hypothetical protein [Flavobacterium sharifuzzamanii]|uniref:hypothetical protein n=1 Tax=Flavobacterium sharifuzzamanii TaxID=2211133 RepID=UPI000DAC1B90|nr:hypothetical protein [Flavobacterium sharifuzzamanii]KAF2082032.1 hypothetical protein DMA14_06060 [Flavobacterium sharifuzzamanii]
MSQVLYFLSYDLVKVKDYPKLYEELEKFKAKRVLESVWSFKYESGKSEDLRDHFLKFIDKDDRLLVIQSHGWWSKNLIFNPNNF